MEDVTNGVVLIKCKLVPLTASCNFRPVPYPIPEIFDFFFFFFKKILINPQGATLTIYNWANLGTVTPYAVLNLAEGTPRDAQTPTSGVSRPPVANLIKSDNPRLVFRNQISISVRQGHDLLLRVRSSAGGYLGQQCGLIYRLSLL